MIEKDVLLPSFARQADAEFIRMYFFQRVSVKRPRQIRRASVQHPAEKPLRSSKAEKS